MALYAITQMKKGQKIKLESFNGTTIPDNDTDDHENYWKLINEKGTLISFAHEKGVSNKSRVLIKFDNDVKSMGLECHNDEPNSLWILASDLSKL